MKLSLIVASLAVLAVLVIGCEQNSTDSIPIATPTVTRADAESRYAKHCMKADTISEPLLREFNDMTVDRIDGFANGCEMTEKHKHE